MHDKLILELEQYQTRNGRTIPVGFREHCHSVFFSLSAQDRKQLELLATDLDRDPDTRDTTCKKIRDVLMACDSRRETVEAEIV